MIIAVDFDGTIVEHKYPSIGKSIPFALDTLKQLQNEHHQLILWTVREGELLKEAVDYCESNGLRFYAHNANFPEEDRSTATRKLKADMFIDDRNFGGLPDWGLIYQAIRNEQGHRLIFKEDFLLEKDKKSGKKGWSFF
ncbi:BT0820 family HAD-type phosphatase [Mucilaginibacter lappiensis]|uniref:Hydrolase n=1 Tax=Mucilaginibacter lappiensis TaxID=354630 RepID=A0A841JJU8_9SPHI|nr:hypothetical protein [Mucilaginibacter lappiensis]MBB6130754.1 hypothetical protein [Mucilaginibacter lappiensis]